MRNLGKPHGVEPTPIDPVFGMRISNTLIYSGAIERGSQMRDRLIFQN